MRGNGNWSMWLFLGLVGVLYLMGGWRSTYGRWWDWLHHETLLYWQGLPILEIWDSTNSQNIPVVKNKKKCNIPFSKFLQTSKVFLSTCLSDLGMRSLRHPFTIPLVWATVFWNSSALISWISELSNGWIGDFIRAGALSGEARVGEADMGAGGKERE